MIERLTVENYALIERLDVELSPALNIVTGETGAGKSILLGALSLLLGAKADAAAVADQSRNCVVEGHFAVAGYGLEELFAENDIDYDPDTVIRRVINPQGKSRAYINDIPVQQATLKEVVMRLVDIHSQHQSLMIGDESFRIRVVDSLAGHAAILEQYRDAYSTLKTKEGELVRLLDEAEQSKKEEEYLRFQCDQLVSAALKEGEQQELEQQQNELTHAEKIGEALGGSLEALEDDETGVMSRLKNISTALTKLAPVYPAAERLAQRIETILIEAKDINAEMSAEYQRIDADPAALDKLNERLSLLFSLQQKHHVGTVDELIALREGFVARLALIDNFDQALADVRKEVDTLARKATDLAAAITKGRAKAATVIEKQVIATLARLGMGDSVLQVSITPAARLTPTGGDSIEFLFSANKGTTPQPAGKIASGGEVSRLMLAIKSLVARSLKLPTIIFDEIDTGVSGRIADAIGEIIVELSAAMQVVNITHLPQVASKGDTHLLVYKESSKTRLRKLSHDERVTEIAQMLSGSDITEAAIAQARHLLG